VSWRFVRRPWCTHVTGVTFGKTRTVSEVNARTSAARRALGAGLVRPGPRRRRGREWPNGTVRASAATKFQGAA
jgi:hypothetical protein